MIIYDVYYQYALSIDTGIIWIYVYVLYAHANIDLCFLCH